MAHLLNAVPTWIVTVAVAVPTVAELRCWGTSFDAAQQNAAQRTRVQGLIADLNAPYGGPIRVSADTWTSVINSMR